MKTKRKIIKKLKFDMLLDEWYYLQQPQLKESTSATYNTHIQKHIKPYFNNMPLSKISNANIQKFINDKLYHGRLDKKGGLSVKSVKELVNVIKLSLKYAIKNEYISTFNFDFKFPSQTAQIQILDDKEYIKLISFLKKEKTSVSIGVLLILCTGLRIGEVCALKNSDIDFEKQQLHINKTLQRIQNINEKSTKVIITTTKTKNSNRIIPIPKAMLPYMKVIENDYYFLTQSKDYIEPRNFRYNFKRILRNLELSEVTVHSLRHYFATKCIELGFDYNCLSEILGHSSVSTTMNLYVHSKNEYKKTCMDKIKF